MKKAMAAALQSHGSHLDPNRSELLEIVDVGGCQV